MFDELAMDDCNNRAIRPAVRIVPDIAEIRGSTFPVAEPPVAKKTGKCRLVNIAGVVIISPPVG